MIRLLLALLLAMPAAPAAAQAADPRIGPEDISLTVEVEDIGVTPYQGEMVLVTIHGAYRLPITLEKLRQPDLAGFSWMQLGPDHWYETTVRGRKVKNLRRRMALFPERSGRLEIGAFMHELTLLDAGLQRFEHVAISAPVTVDVRPAPVVDGWWFPVRRLEITDAWSNPPDQLGPGEGALRIITVTAWGVAPEMMPPMPELTSPGAQVFAHPERRLTELSPLGPMSVAFWRWTVKPRNPPSAILEPIELAYFDTVTRTHKTVRISPQRIATRAAPVAGGPPPPPATLRGGLLAVLTGAAFVAALAALAAGRRLSGLAGVRARLGLDPARLALRRCARRGDLAGLRRAARTLDRTAVPDAGRAALLATLDRALFAPQNAQGFDAARFRLGFLATLRPLGDVNGDLGSATMRNKSF